MKKTRERNLILEFKHITLDDKPIFDDYFPRRNIMVRNVILLRYLFGVNVMMFSGLLVMGV